MLAVAATCLVAALVGAPTAGAAQSSSQTSAKAQAAVTKKKLARDIASVRRRTNAARRSIRTIGGTLAALQNTVNGLRTAGAGTQGQVNGILAAVPQVLDGLTQLRDASVALKGGLETLAAKTTEGFTTVQGVLTTIGGSLTKVATSQEYGNIRVFTGPGAAGPALPITFGSADIPDDGNGSPAQGELPISVGANPGQVPEGTLLTLRAAIRSGEADGGEEGDPAGQVGGLMTMKCGLGGGAGGSCDADPGAGEVLIPPGAPMCIQGPPPPQEIELPDGTTGNFPIVTIQEAADRTDISRPNKDDPNPLAGANNPAPLPNDNDDADGCNLPETGSTVFLTVQAQFFDIPTSTKPDLDD